MRFLQRKHHFFIDTKQKKINCSSFKMFATCKHKIDNKNRESNFFLVQNFVCFYSSLKTGNSITCQLVKCVWYVGLDENTENYSFSLEQSNWLFFLRTIIFKLWPKIRTLELWRINLFSCSNLFAFEKHMNFFLIQFIWIF